MSLTTCLSEMTKEQLLAEVRAARSALANNMPRETRVALVRHAFEAGKLSAGDGAQILGETVRAFLGRRWTANLEIEQARLVTKKMRAGRDALRYIVSRWPDTFEAHAAAEALEEMRNIKE